MAKRYRKPYSIRKKRYWWKSKFLWFGIIALFLSAVIVYGAIFSSVFALEKITIEGNRKVSTEDIESAVSPFTKQYLIVLELQNMLFINSEQISSHLLESFSVLESTQVQRKFLNEIHITVKERRQTAIWCVKEECFAFDKEGIAFEKQSIGGSVVFSQEEGSSPILGESIIDSDLLFSLQQLTKQIQVFPAFSDTENRVTSITLISDDKIAFSFSEGWDIYITAKEDLDWQRTKLELVLEEKVSVDRRENLEYIDLRFGSQAFIKDKE